MTPRKVPKYIMDAYELRSGFHGLGKFMEQRGDIVLIDTEGFECQSSRK